MVRLRLSHWNVGQLKHWPGHETLNHPEVRRPVSSDLYLGYGPLQNGGASRGTALKTQAAIQAREHATLNLALPEAHMEDISTALWLIDRYGTVGGRSRNGWGALSLEPANEQSPPLRGLLAQGLARNWKEALTSDWPHAVGMDAQGALVWQTRPFPDWPELMQELARLKIGLRTQFMFTTGEGAPRPEDRHWISYPVTRHSVRDWGANARLPNSLRFKVRPALSDAQSGAQQVVGVIFHMPCLPPPAFQPQLPAITRVWERVHAFLDDESQQLTRITA